MTIPQPLGCNNPRMATVVLDLSGELPGQAEEDLAKAAERIRRKYFGDIDDIPRPGGTAYGGLYSSVGGGLCGLAPKPAATADEEQDS